MLGVFLRIGEQLGLERQVVLSAGAARPRARNRAQRGLAMIELDQGFG